MIEITKDIWTFKFSSLNVENFLTCFYCEDALDYTYSYIISKLKEKNLLQKDYKPICCYCYVLKKFGLLEYSRDKPGIVWSPSTDILWIIIDEDDSEPEIHFKIHNFSKLKL